MVLTEDEIFKKNSKDCGHWEILSFHTNVNGHVFRAHIT